MGKVIIDFDSKILQATDKDTMEEFIGIMDTDNFSFFGANGFQVDVKYEFQKRDYFSKPTLTYDIFSRTD